MPVTIQLLIDTKNAEVLLQSALSAVGKRPVRGWMKEKVDKPMRNLFNLPFEYGGTRPGARQKRWAPYSPSYARRVGSKVTLQRRGDLRQAVTGTPGEITEHADDLIITWGTSIPVGYFPYHQQGTRTIPQRRMIFLAESDPQWIQSSLLKFIREHINARRQ